MMFGLRLPRWWAGPDMHRRIAHPGLATGLTLAATAAMVGCADAETDTPTPTFQPASIESAGEPVDLPDGAWSAAETAAEQCDAITTELVVGKIATTSNYDAEFTDSHGGAGYSGMYPEKWKEYGTADLSDRADLDVATRATALELCASYDVAEQLADEGVSGSVDDLALSVSLVGERFTRDEGLADTDDEFDPHDVRAQITDITDAAASVATT